MTVGSNITKFRKEKKLTQEELANLINVSPKTISSYENNRNLPNIETLILLSEVLEVSIDEIIGTTKEDKIVTKEKYNKKRKHNLLIILAISMFSLCIFCIHEFILVGSIVSTSEELKTIWSLGTLIKLIINNGLFYLVSVILIYIIYYYKLDEKKPVLSIILSFLILFVVAIILASI